MFVRFPQEESGRLRKLSCPWHGHPYRITSLSGPDACVSSYYHLPRVKLSPPNLPAGFYWYRHRCRREGLETEVDFNVLHIIMTSINILASLNEG